VKVLALLAACLLTACGASPVVRQEARIQPLVCDATYSRILTCECGCVAGFCSTSTEGALVCDASTTAQSSLGLGLSKNRQLRF